MSTGERIRKLGFKRWYERTLIESHAYLVTALLGMILAFAGVEMIGAHQGVAPFLLGAGTTGLGMLVVGLGIPRYFRTLMLAQSFGERATCGQCHAYAAFNVLACGVAGTRETEGPTSSWLRVRCRCGNEWRI